MKSRDTSEDKVVLVSGSSGFLGRSIVDGLESTHNVIFTSYRTPRLNAVPYKFFSDDIDDILSGLTPDTSLDTSLWQQLTGAKPLSIEDTLST